MPDILVRDLSKQTIDKLKKQAKSRNRSLQQEVKTVLENAAGFSLADFAERAKRLREKIRRTHLIQSDSVDLIREDRER